MAGPGEPPHDPPKGDREVIPNNDGKRTTAEKEQMLPSPNHNDQPASDRNASQEQGNAGTEPEDNNNEAQDENAESNRAPPSPTLSQQEAFQQMMFDLGNHRVNELSFDDDKRGTANKNSFYIKSKPAAKVSKAARPFADFGDDGDDNDIANAYNSE